MSDAMLSGERLADANPLYGADLSRHRAAYLHARTLAAGRRVLDLGCGTGYGAAELADVARPVVALDRVAPGASARGSGACFVRGDLQAVPLAPASFDLVVSFQVIEHLVDPTRYLQEVAAALAPDGVALISTPNILQSDRENPYHVHEYEARELESVLARHFGAVEMRGVGLEGPALRYHAERLAGIRRITRLDPLGLRRRLPRGWIDWLFERLSLVVRRTMPLSRSGEGVRPEHFPIGPADAACVDLLAACRAPRPVR